ncbi:MAG: HDIG domain-containing protein, partial [Anaerolineaceae bacterium]|nr:HDIG domain-containing protein [Anaerolineaceae bacterium]
ARESIQPVTYSYAAGETIVQSGQVVTPLIIEALEQYNLVKPGGDTRTLLATTILVLLISVSIGSYFSRRNFEFLKDFKNIALLSSGFLIFLYIARLLVPNRTIIPYVFPLPAFGLTFGSLFSAEIGLVFSFILSILSTYGITTNQDLTVFYLLSSICGLLVLGKGRRVANFIYAGFAIGGAGSAVVLAYRLPGQITDWVGIITLIGAAFFNGMASASVSLLFQFIFSQALGLTTALQLMELSRPDHPLLQFIMRNSPGTYQHSLQVGNLAEQAAEAIGADALLVRVGAIYHDAGKSLNPSFYIENQVPGQTNPHDDLDPKVSSTNIIQHIHDGLQLARKYRLPPRIQDFIREHHGSMITRYQYVKALEAVGGNPSALDIDTYRYPGPAPH